MAFSVGQDSFDTPVLSCSGVNCYKQPLLSVGHEIHHVCQQNPLIKSQLNGNNGEFTNGDDMQFVSFCVEFASSLLSNVREYIVSDIINPAFDVVINTPIVQNAVETAQNISAIELPVLPRGAPRWDLVSGWWGNTIVRYSVYNLVRHCSSPWYWLRVAAHYCIRRDLAEALTRSALTYNIDQTASAGAIAFLYSLTRDDVLWPVFQLTDMPAVAFMASMSAAEVSIYSSVPVMQSVVDIWFISMLVLHRLIHAYNGNISWWAASSLRFAIMNFAQQSTRLDFWGRAIVKYAVCGSVIESLISTSLTYDPDQNYGEQIVAISASVLSVERYSWPAIQWRRAPFTAIAVSCGLVESYLYSSFPLLYVVDIWFISKAIWNALMHAYIGNKMRGPSSSVIASNPGKSEEMDQSRRIEKFVDYKRENWSALIVDDVIPRIFRNDQINYLKNLCAPDVVSEEWRVKHATVTKIREIVDNKFLNCFLKINNRVVCCLCGAEDCVSLSNHRLAPCSHPCRPDGACPWCDTSVGWVPILQATHPHPEWIHHRVKAIGKAPVSTGAASSSGSVLVSAPSPPPPAGCPGGRQCKDANCVHPHPVPPAPLSEDQLHEITWNQIFADIAAREGASVPCPHCARVHKGLCGGLLDHYKSHPVASSSRFRTYAKKFGLFDVVPDEASFLQPFVMQVPNDWDDWCFGLGSLFNDYFGCRKSIRFDMLRDRYPITPRDRVDPRFNRELDHSQRVNPDIRRCRITTNRGPMFKQSCREVWVSVELINFLLKRDLSINSTQSSLMASFQRSTASSDHIHIPLDLTLRIPGLVADSQIFALSFALKCVTDRTAELEVLQGNGGCPTAGQSSSGTIGRTGNSSLATGSSIPRSAYLLGGVALLSACALAGWYFGRSVPPSPSATEVPPSLIRKLLIGWRQSVVP